MHKSEGFALCVKAHRRGPETKSIESQPRQISSKSFVLSRSFSLAPVSHLVCCYSPLAKAIVIHASSLSPTRRQGSACIQSQSTASCILHALINLTLRSSPVARPEQHPQSPTPSLLFCATTLYGDPLSSSLVK